MPRTDKPRVYLPVEDWPAQDRSAFDALFVEGDILDDAGPARHWRPATRRNAAEHYARWLGWLAREGRLDRAADPADRIEPDSVLAYARHLVDRLAPSTATAALVVLRLVAQAMAPTRDWGWFLDITRRLNAWARPVVDRSACQRPVEEIHAACLAELDRLRATPLSRRLDRIAVRDALVVLLLSACPIRLLNLTGLELGQHLRREGERWAIHLPGAETKNGQRLHYLLPRTLCAPLALYLERVRPGFGPAPTSTALWLGTDGRPLGRKGLQASIRRTTRRLFGTPINPHSFRSCAATSLVERAPEAARLAAPLLGHRYFSTTERYYVKAEQLLASRQVNDTLGLIRAGLEQEKKKE